MYYPIQIPHLLRHTFRQYVCYTEETVPELQDFAICIWRMEAETGGASTVENVIVPDVCIDLVADFETRQIGFSGMSQTEFHYIIHPPTSAVGVRLKPGAFRCLTGLPATAAMDCFLPLGQLDSGFDQESFFNRPLAEADSALKNYLAAAAAGKQPTAYMTLFEKLYAEEIPRNASALYRQLHFSPRQCQRLFLEHYGISPKMTLSVMRFQQSMHALTEEQDTRAAVKGYYDQPHFIREIKKNIGITPRELLRDLH